MQTEVEKATVEKKGESVRSCLSVHIGLAFEKIVKTAVVKWAGNCRLIVAGQV